MCRAPSPPLQVILLVVGVVVVVELVHRVRALVLVELIGRLHHVLVGIAILLLGFASASASVASLAAERRSTHISVAQSQRPKRRSVESKTLAWYVALITITIRGSSAMMDRVVLGRDLAMKMMVGTLFSASSSRHAGQQKE